MVSTTTRNDGLASHMFEGHRKSSETKSYETPWLPPQILLYRGVYAPFQTTPIGCLVSPKRLQGPPPRTGGQLHELHHELHHPREPRPPGHAGIKVGTRLDSLAALSVVATGCLRITAARQGLLLRARVSLTCSSGLNKVGEVRHPPSPRAQSSVQPSPRVNTVTKTVLYCIYSSGP
jgi:hypothetical protein